MPKRRSNISPHRSYKAGFRVHGGTYLRFRDACLAMKRPMREVIEAMMDEFAEGVASAKATNQPQEQIDGVAEQQEQQQHGD